MVNKDFSAMNAYYDALPGWIPDKWKYKLTVRHFKKIYH